MTATGREYSDVEYVFTPAGPTRRPLREYLREVWDRREFAVAYGDATLRSIRSNTVLGELWGILDPLFQAVLWWFLFMVIRGGSRTLDQLTIIVGCVFLFDVTRAALAEGSRSVPRSKGLLLNSMFPRALLPLSAIYRGVLELRTAVPVYIVIHLALGAPIHAGLLLIPPLFAIQLVLSTGVSLLLCTAVVKVRDVSNLLNHVLRLLLFITPVIYPYELLSDTLRSILMINPFFTLFASYQLILGGDVPSPWLMAQSVAWAILAICLGVRVFRRHEHSFALYV